VEVNRPFQVEPCREEPRWNAARFLCHEMQCTNSAMHSRLVCVRAGLPKLVSACCRIACHVYAAYCCRQRAGSDQGGRHGDLPGGHELHMGREAPDQEALQVPLERRVAVGY
jgi:hypothetical protein